MTPKRHTHHPNNMALFGLVKSLGTMFPFYIDHIHSIFVIYLVLIH